MQTKVNKLEHSEVEILLTFSKEEWQQATKKSFDKLAAGVNVPGFRKGKAPANIVKSHLDQNKVFNHAIDALLPDAYSSAISEAKLTPWSRPGVDVTKLSDTELEIKIKVLIAPEVKLGKYKNLKIEKKTVKVSEQDVKNEIKNLQTQNAEMVVKEGLSEMGDTLVFDFEGFVAGVAFEGGKAENYSLELGSGQFIPGFEEQLVGLKAGDEKEVKVTFPAAYKEELAGKEAVFKIKTHEVKFKKLPEIGQSLFDELKISEVTSLETLQEHVKKDLTKKQQEDADKEYFEKLVDKVAAASEMDLAHQIIHDQMDAMKEDLQKQVEKNGMTLEKYLELSGQTQEQLDAKMHEDAERNIRNSLVLEKIAEVEAIEVTPELIDFEMAKIADQYKMEFNKVKEILSKDINRFVADIRSRHVRDFLIQNNN